jgi:hypothetical protein
MSLHMHGHQTKGTKRKGAPPPCDMASHQSYCKRHYEAHREAIPASQRLRRQDPASRAKMRTYYAHPVPPGQSRARYSRSRRSRVHVAAGSNSSAASVALPSPSHTAKCWLAATACSTKIVAREYVAPSARRAAPRLRLRARPDVAYRHARVQPVPARTRGR